MKRQTPIISITLTITAILLTGCESWPNFHPTFHYPKAISLAGQWRFKLDPNNVGIDNHWCTVRLTDRIKLPGSTAENGYGDDVSVDTKWTGGIVDRSWFTDPAYEEYRQPGNVKVPFWLTPVKHYVGPAWYQKQVNIPKSFADKRITLFLERCHWESRVWIDDKPAGIQDSLSTPHVYDLTGLLSPGKHLLTIRVDNSLKYDVGENAHSVSDHTQSNWNGIVGRIELHATDKVYIDDVQVYPDIENKTAKVRVTIANAAGSPIRGTLTAYAAGLSSGQPPTPGPKTTEFNIPQGQTTLELDCPMGNDATLWDEFSPAMYQMAVSLAATGDGQTFADQRAVTFGVRKFAAKGTQFTINDRPTFLRGTLECCIFPLTGYPPSDVTEWTRILKVAKAHGLNHLRFHSWCPPEAAFTAADRMGFMFHIECAAWTAIGDGKPIDKFIYDESDRILKAYGNHPSFCMLAYGNEPGGQNQKRWLGDLVNYWRQKDPRRLYTSAAGWPIIPENQYHSTPAPRGHQWGAGLKSRFNANPPETLTDYRDSIKNYDVPVVSHEIGQWCVYPNFAEISKYKGVLKARNFEIFRDSLADHHMLDQAHDFLIASGKLQALLYKEEIESALRTPGFGGFQLLDLHDFPGQGTALVGILDPFWNSKGYITAAEHNRYCAETVPLLRMKKRIWTTAETFAANAEIAHFGPTAIRNAAITWSIDYPDGRKLAAGQLPTRTIPIGNGIQLGKIEVPLAPLEAFPERMDTAPWLEPLTGLADAGAPAQLSITLSLEGTKYSNNWDIWVYPADLDTKPPQNVIIAERLDESSLAALDAGRSVLLMPPLSEINSDVPPGFTSIFWNTAWTGRQPPHTLGILCDPKHPALADFPTEFHSNWQWWDLVTKSRFLILDEFPPALRPIVQVIDDWTTNRRLGLIFEAKVSKGKLLFCSIDLCTDLDNRPVARQMLRSLLDYMQTDAFNPPHKLGPDLIRTLFREPPLLSRLKSVAADSHHPDYPPQNAVDANPDTIWHTHWENNPPGYPHQITLEFPEPVAIKGLKYLPRQDMANGWISKYEVYASDNPDNWGQPVAKGAFQKGRTEQRITFGNVQKTRFLRLVALEGFDGQIFASIADLDLIPATDK